MNNKLFMVFISCAIISNCNKATESEFKENKTTGGHNPTESDMPMEVSQNQRPHSQAVGGEQNAGGEKIVHNEAEGEVSQMNCRKAELVKNPLKKVGKLNPEEIEYINNSIRDGPLLPADPNLFIATAGEAFERVNISLSMATAPEVFAEDKEYYYFSGGLSVDRVDDFSSGIRISKNGGAIHVWPRGH